MNEREKNILKLQNKCFVMLFELITYLEYMTSGDTGAATESDLISAT